MDDEIKYYSEDYWYNSPQEHEDVSNYDENYYAYKIYENLILKLPDIPKYGYIVCVGTNK